MRWTFCDLCRLSGPLLKFLDWLYKYKGKDCKIYHSEKVYIFENVYQQDKPKNLYRLLYTDIPTVVHWYFCREVPTMSQKNKGVSMNYT